MRIDMVAEGPKFGWYAEPIRIRNAMDFAETMADWPKDHEGTFTLERSNKVIQKHARHSQEAYAPIKRKSRFNCVWAMFNTEGEWIGYWRHKISEGKKIHMGQAAIHPDHRGQGHMRTLVHMEIFMAFYVYKCKLWSFEVGNKVPAVMSKIDRSWGDKAKGGGNKTGERISTSVKGQVTERFEMTLKEHLKNYGTVKHPADIAEGMDMARLGLGYKNVFRYSK